MNQKIKTVLIPEIGLNLEPSHVMKSEVETDFTRALAHLVCQSPAGPVMVRGTTGGNLTTATVGIAFETYVVEAGNAPNAYDGPNTFDQVDPFYVTDVLIEAFDATVQFRNQAGMWGDAKAFPVGFYSIDFMHYGMRIQNRVPASVAVYEFTIYR